MQALLVTIANLAVIFLTVVWSGSVDDKTLYDKYIVRFEGLIAPRSNPESNREFYRKVLNFPEVEDKVASYFGKTAYAITPSGKLYFRDAGDLSGHTPVILIRVRNGIKKLHKEIVQRLGEEQTQVVPASALAGLQSREVSQLFRGSYGDQFVTADPDGNQILFYQKRLALFR